MPSLQLIIIEAKPSFLCLKNENIMEGIFSNRKEIHIPTHIYIPIEEGIKNVVTKGIIPADNRSNQ